MQKLLVIPSLDIKHGKTVRVVKGIPELDCAQYGDDPLEMARIWRTENAKFIHIVDYDGAHTQSKRNFKVVEEICSSLIIPVEFAGGIRSYNDTVEIMSAGVSRVAINTMALENRKDFLRVLEKFGPSKIYVSLDIRDEELVTHGRTKKTGILYTDFIKEMVETGINRFLVCDISRNGLLEGPNIELAKKVAEFSGAKVTLAGGIRNKDELLDIQKLVPIGVDSVIIGRALYENRFPCQKLWRVAESGIFN
ncbi:MAG: 1-(5-phosphoribosyl)-5-[(5-phosphoribosylamino)methylideneamino] imidazole-4-carboxamide isomerase [Ignavibacteria bacterium]|jgi:phosphoribosylformimino-5-aminoimidazole carboxamide ribotide isomerase